MTPANIVSIWDDSYNLHYRICFWVDKVYYVGIIHMRMVLQDSAHDEALPVDPGQLRYSARKPRHLEAAAAAADVLCAQHEVEDAHASQGPFTYDVYNIFGLLGIFKSIHPPI